MAFEVGNGGSIATVGSNRFRDPAGPTNRTSILCSSFLNASIGSFEARDTATTYLFSTFEG
jgi:hypothetical protein